MYEDITIFKENETKSQTLTLRLTARQKECIIKLAAQKKLPVSKYILGIVGVDYEHSSKTLTTANNTKQSDKAYYFDTDFDFGYDCLNPNSGSVL